MARARRKERSVLCDTRCAHSARGNPAARIAHTSEVKNSVRDDARVRVQAVECAARRCAQCGRVQYGSRSRVRTRQR